MRINTPDLDIFRAAAVASATDSGLAASRPSSTAFCLHATAPHPRLRLTLWVESQRARDDPRHATPSPPAQRSVRSCAGPVRRTEYLRSPEEPCRESPAPWPPGCPPADSAAADASDAPGQLPPGTSNVTGSQTAIRALLSYGGVQPTVTSSSGVGLAEVPPCGNWQVSKARVRESQLLPVEFCAALVYGSIAAGQSPDSRPILTAKAGSVRPNRSCTPACTSN
eukprot:scaffold535_cov260-Pinguiococcus_pyrenoidosus.AAC.36